MTKRNGHPASGTAEPSLRNQAIKLLERDVLPILSRAIDEMLVLEQQFAPRDQHESASLKQAVRCLIDCMTSIDDAVATWPKPAVRGTATKAHGASHSLARKFTPDQRRQLRVAAGLDNSHIGRLEQILGVVNANLGTAPSKSDLTRAVARMRSNAATLSASISDPPGTLRIELLREGADLGILESELDRLVRGTHRIQPQIDAYKDARRKPRAPILLIADVVGDVVPPSGSEQSRFRRVLDIVYRAAGAASEQLPEKSHVYKALGLRTAERKRNLLHSRSQSRLLRRAVAKAM